MNKIEEAIKAVQRVLMNFAEVERRLGREREAKVFELQVIRLDNVLQSLAPALVAGPVEQKDINCCVYDEHEQIKPAPAEKVCKKFICTECKDELGFTIMCIANTNAGEPEACLISGDKCTWRSCSGKIEEVKG